MKEVTILKGFHRPLFSMPYLDMQLIDVGDIYQLTAKFKFTEDSKYELDSDSESEWHDLIGLSFNAGDYSECIVWRYNLIGIFDIGIRHRKFGGVSVTHCIWVAPGETFTVSMNLRTIALVNELKIDINIEMDPLENSIPIRNNNYNLVQPIGIQIFNANRMGPRFGGQAYKIKSPKKIKFYQSKDITINKIL